MLNPLPSVHRHSPACRRRAAPSLFAWVPIALILSACGASVPRGVTVIAQAEPNPLANQRQFFVAPIVFDGINIEGRTEAEFAMGPPEDVMRYQEGRRRLVTQFFIGLAGRNGHYQVSSLETPVAPPGSFVVRVLPLYLRQTINRQVVGVIGVSRTQGQVTPGTLTSRVQIFTADGRMVDDMRIFAQTYRDGPIEGQMRDMGDSLGGFLRRYLDTRTGIE